MRKIHLQLCYCVLLFGTACGLNAQNTSAGHAEFEAFPAGLEHKLLQSFVSNDATQLALLKQPNTADDPMYSIWRSNRIDWSARVEAANLMFSADSIDKGDQPSGSNSFGVQLRYDEQDQHIVVRSDSPATKKYLGGLRFAFNKDRGWAAVLPGKAGRSILVVVARMSADLDKVVYVCPLDKELTGDAAKYATPVAQALDYALVNANFEVSGHALAKVQSGAGPGWARTAILTSAQIPATQPFEDAAFMHDPKVNLEYTADKSEQLAVNANAADYLGGIKVTIFLQNNAGYVRESVNQQVVWVRRMKNDLALNALLNGSQVSVKPKQCAMVVKAARSGHSYSKQPLIEPTPEPIAAPVGPTPSSSM